MLAQRDSEMLPRDAHLLGQSGEGKGGGAVGRIPAVSVILGFLDATLNHHGGRPFRAIAALGELLDGALEQALSSEMSLDRTATKLRKPGSSVMASKRGAL